MNKKLLSVAKWAWTLGVFVAGGWYLYRHIDALWEPLSALSLGQLLAALLLILTGKILLIDVARRSTAALGHHFAVRQMAYMTLISQLGKYLPGGVWHLVGRAGMYRSRGMGLRLGSKAILLEQAWLVVSAFCFGGMLAWASVSDHLQLPPGLSPTMAAWLGFFVFGSAWYVALRLSSRLLAVPGQRGWRGPTIIIAEQAVVWTVIGLSLWVLMPGGDTVAAALAAIGAFAVAWTVGYVAVFAPGGIGVREAVLVAILAPVVPVEQAAVYAAVSRIVWTLAELILGAVAYLFLGDANGLEIKPAPAAKEFGGNINAEP